MSTLSVHDRIAKARIKLVLDDPFFGVICMRWEVVEAHTDTMATDGNNLYYNSQFVQGLTDDELLGVIVHEAMHVALLHMLRLGKREHLPANIAMDYAINPTICERYTLPAGGCNDPKYANWTFEDIYDDLMKNPPPPPPQGGGSGDGEEGKGPWGQVMKPTDKNGQELSESEMKVMEADMKSTISNAVAVAKKQGKMPANMERFIDKLLKPQVDWREKLRAVVTGMYPVDYTWRRFNRRLEGEGIYAPSILREGAGEIVVGIDTSGSIGKKELTTFFSELAAIAEEVIPEKVHILYIDSEVSGVDTFEAGDEIVARPRGGGGTDFRPAFKWTEDNGVSPQALVYFTDMYGSFPDAPPHYPVIWVSTSDINTAPFGEVINVR
jgi:predicted metal-dependent peptidase